MRALEQAGTVVCEPIARASLEIPADAMGVVMPALARLGAGIDPPSLRANICTIDAVLPAARVHDLQRQLPGLTRGEGVLESSFEGYEPMSSTAPTRQRTTPNPLNLGEYTMHLARRV
jgi:ribosomal protection tetracycline resistance protein